MNNHEQRFLVDTNIWLDYSFPSRTLHEQSLAFVDCSYKAGAELLYTPSTLKDVFYLVARKIKEEARAENGRLTQADALSAKEIAWGVVESIRRNATAVGVDESDAWLACKYRTLHDDLEDNLVLAAMERSKASFLVTNDEALIKHAPVPVLSAEDALAQLRFACGEL